MQRWQHKLMTDEALMKAYARGNTLAFESLYQRHKRGLFLYLRRQCEQVAICEDLAHDTWMAVIRAAESYVASAKFKTWLYSIAYRRLTDHRRKFGASARVLFDEISDAIGATDDASSDALELEDLLRNLKLVSAEQIETLLLKVEGFSHDEIAEITGAKRETVKSRLRYATQKLRAAMEVTS